MADTRIEPTPAPGVTITRGPDDSLRGNTLTVNFGPHHGGIEKRMEARRWRQALVPPLRHDYLSPPINNLAYSLAVERLMGVEVPPRAQVLRVIMSELTRS